MGATFIQPFPLIPPEGIPKELDNFVYRHGAVVDAGTVVVGYALTGDIPVGLSVDGNGVISGKIEHFGNQPSCQFNNAEKEKPLESGKNWQKNGRFLPSSFDFDFTITITWKLSAGAVEEFTTSKRCIVKLKKDNNIDNLIYFSEYAKYYDVGENFDITSIR